MEAIKPFLITPGLLILGGILIKITLSLLINHISYKYPEVHNLYFDSDMHNERARMANFILGFVLAGSYKEELNPEDFKYVKRVKFTLRIMAICIGVSLYDVYG